MDMARPFGFLIATTVTVGCVSGPALNSDPVSLESRDVCRLRQSALQKGNDEIFDAATAEIERRGYTVQDCYRWAAGDELDKQARTERIKQGLALAAVALGAAAVAYSAAHQSGSSGTQSVTYDREWDWDLFHDQYGNLVAACRGVQTGQFADGWRCSGKAQTDWRWPGQ
jgi:hypothetical protein